MKKYVKPETQVVTVKIASHLLQASGSETMGFGSGQKGAGESLSRGSDGWDEEE